MDKKLIKAEVTEVKYLIKSSASLLDKQLNCSKIAFFSMQLTQINLF